MTLDEWQGRLERHFAELVANRDTEAFPLFALEHPCGTDELRGLRHLLLASLKNGTVLRRHWLPWVVYATEIGYDYDGGEYWQTFEQKTPGWIERASRWQIRGWFEKFQKTYNGVQPTGPWAEHFSIIAWPITHAVLPKYLQLQLARTLHVLRFQLAGLKEFEPTEVGRTIAAMAFDASSRFREFLEQEELVGRIVRALLLEEEPDSSGPLFHPTLERITTDLLKARHAAQWLKDARRVVSVRFKGAGRTAGWLNGQARTSEPQQEKRQQETPRISIQPFLTLRRDAPNRWTPIVEFSGFAALSQLNADLCNFLRTTRCRVPSAGDTYLPAGWLLFGTPRRPITIWPNPNAALLEFERSHRMLENLVLSDCRLSKGQFWLFRVGPDGIGREIGGRIVRGGSEYVIASLRELAVDTPMFEACDLTCSGVAAYRLRVPPTLSRDAIETLDKIGISVARTIEIRPAALMSRGWDGEGRSEWLTTERPIFALIHDHPVDSYSLRLNQGPEQVIEAKAPGVPTFIQLPQLPAGRHRLAALVRRASIASIREATSEGDVTLDVRQPATWVPGTTSHVGMSFQLSPIDSTLDELWNEEVELSVQGPPAYAATCSLSLLRADDSEILNKVIAKFDLPLNSQTWAKSIHRFVDDHSHAVAYMQATEARVVFRAEELGEFTLRFQQPRQPVRWVCTQVGDKTTVRLVDETGYETPPTITQFPFSRPLEAGQLSDKTALTGFNCAPPGALFTAQSGVHRDAVIVSTRQVDGGLQGLASDVPRSNYLDDGTDTDLILRQLNLWMKARLIGPLAKIRRDRSVRPICRLLYARLCGARWSRAEDAFLDSPSDSTEAGLVAAVDRQPGFAICLQREYRQDQRAAQKVPWFAKLASQFGVSSDPKVAEFALQVAHQPQRLVEIESSRLHPLLRQLSDKAPLLRGARLLAVLDVAKRKGGPGSAIPRSTWRS